MLKQKALFARKLVQAKSAKLRLLLEGVAALAQVLFLQRPKYHHCINCQHANGYPSAELVAGSVAGKQCRKQHRSEEVAYTVKRVGKQRHFHKVLLTDKARHSHRARACQAADNADTGSTDYQHGEAVCICVKDTGHYGNTGSQCKADAYAESVTQEAIEYLGY